MTAPTASVPRYLPTLTEVVNLPIAGESSLPPENLENSTDPMQDTVDRVVQRLIPMIQIKLKEMLATVIHEEIRVMAPRLMEDIEQMTRQMVTQALVQNDELN
jgi:hypothetical protein